RLRERSLGTVLCRFEVRCHQSGDRAGRQTAYADLGLGRRVLAGERPLEGLHERLRVFRQISRQAHIRVTAAAEIAAQLAVPVDVLVQAGEVGVFQMSPLSHSFTSSPLPASASKALSSAILSQMVRPSTLTGFGMRPSATMASNLVVPRPTYSAAASRQR